MRILFITRACNQSSGGMERLSYELIKETAQLAGIKTDVIAHRGSRLTSPLFVIVCLPNALLRARHADVIHLGDPMLALPGWLIKLIYRKPVAVTMHGLDIIYPNYFYQQYLRFFLRNFDLYLPISQHVAKLYNNRRKKLNSKTIVINPGVYDRADKPRRDRSHLSQIVTTAAGSLGEKQKVLVTVGRLVARKGHAWFIEQVLPHLSDKPMYLIAGTGPAKEDILRVAQASGVSNQVVLLGRVSDRDLQTIYHTADAFIQPNIPVPDDAEGFGLVLLEAALSTLPVFASRLEGITDAISHEKNGHLLSSKKPAEWIDALNVYLAAPQRDAAARKFTKDNFNWPKQARLFVDCMKQLLRGAD